MEEGGRKEGGREGGREGGKDGSRKGFEGCEMNCVQSRKKQIWV